MTRMKQEGCVLVHTAQNTAQSEGSVSK